MTTGERIRQLRIEHQMTQEELGAKVGVQKAAIYKYENGLIVNLKRSTIEKLALVLDTTPTYLMGMEDDEPQQTTLTSAQTSLLAVFNELNEEGQSKVIEYAEDLWRTGYYKKRGSHELGSKEA
ncbi:transcriptional repressor DicA [Faecalibacterium prausnitzii]|nr:transcriptional repressor DicA [Faecalibacterium prausnitzii]